MLRMPDRMSMTRTSNWLMIGALAIELSKRQQRMTSMHASSKVGWQTRDLHDPFIEGDKVERLERLRYSPMEQPGVLSIDGTVPSGYSLPDPAQDRTINSERAGLDFTTQSASRSHTADLYTLDQE